MPKSQHAKAKAALERSGTPRRARTRSSRSTSSSTRMGPNIRRPLRNLRRIVTRCSRSTTSRPSVGSTCGPRTRSRRRSRRCVTARVSHAQYLTRATFLGLAFKLIEAAEQSWRKIRGVEIIEQLLLRHPLQRRNSSDRKHTGSSTAGRLIMLPDRIPLIPSTLASRMA